MKTLHTNTPKVALMRLSQGRGVRVNTSRKHSQACNDDYQSRAGK